MIRRREFITLLGSAAAWPLAARAQRQQPMPVIGFLTSGGPIFADSAFPFEYSWADGQYDRLPALAAELVRRKVAVIYATGTANSALAAKAATAIIPIVFSNGSDPIKVGLVTSMNRPGGNATGVINFISTLVTKRLGMLRELVPQAKLIGFLTNPANPLSDPAAIQAAARSVGQQMIVLTASTVDEIDKAFAAAAQQAVGALLVDGDVLFNNRHDQFAALAAHYKIPASYPNRVFPHAGGLMSYSDDLVERSRLSGFYIGRILKGDKPADLPVLQPVKFVLVINLKTAKALGLTVPPTLLALADEVIE
jgi:putative ABC transport system substrate-binding protein